MLKNKLLSAMGGAPANYIEDVFSTYLYTGNGSTQTINNGIDLAGEGGLVWIKKRDSNIANTGHILEDTERGANYYLSTNSTNAESYEPQNFSFNSDGFSMDVNNLTMNYASSTYASWTFRKQPKFFDVVTYTGNGTTSRTIAHNLGSVPGCIIVKRTDASSNWAVYHRSIGATNALILQGTNAQFSSDWFGVTPTSSNFYLSDSDTAVNANGGTYVAYLFAHDAGGFGLSGEDNVISCGSFTTDGSGNTALQDLGWEPQFLMTKVVSTTGNWLIQDSMRGFVSSTTGQRYLYPNLSNAESGATDGWQPTATGFQDVYASQGPGRTYIYIAIRRGPMKVPESGTSVFEPVTTASTAQFAVGFPADLGMLNIRGGSASFNTTVGDRLRGGAVKLLTSSTAAESTGYFDFTLQNDFKQSITGADAINYLFRRAPSVFDVVCFTATGTSQSVNHNLQAVPELMICKRRDSATAGNWTVYSAALGNTKILYLNQTAAQDTNNNWDNTTPTSTTFNVNNNISGGTYVNYLFASCPGVSKCGSFTGNGSSQTINCGFTGGARFVLIKATSTTGDWYVWDSARGIVAGNDPYLELNTTDAEVTNTDWVDTAATGFELSNAGGNLANSNGVSYIFLAIA